MNHPVAMKSKKDSGILNQHRGGKLEFHLKANEWKNVFQKLQPSAANDNALQVYHRECEATVHFTASANPQISKKQNEKYIFSIYRKYILGEIFHLYALIIICGFVAFS